MKKIETYAEAFDELQLIVREMEEGSITVDALSEKVKRATELIAFCKQKLTSTEADVEQLLKDLES